MGEDRTVTDQNRTERVASIDIGTNSTRLLVAEAQLVAEADGPAGVGGPVGAGRPRTLERLMTITRLGEAVDRTGRLGEEAISRTIDALRTYREVMDRLEVGPGRVRISATSACRDAANREAFFDAAEQVIGARPELLSGEDEARLSFAGATADLDPELGPFLVFDLGGGSTEFVYGTTGVEGEVEAAHSIDIGCVRLSERFLESDPPQPEELVAAISYTEAWLDEVLMAIPDLGRAGTVVGLAGTVSTVAAVEIGLATYDRDAIHHFVLTKAAAEDVFRTLATERRSDRLHNPGLEEARADVIVGGCCALVAIYRRLGIGEVLVSESDILDGLVLSLI